MAAQRPERAQPIRMSWHLVIDLAHWNVVGDLHALQRVEQGGRVTLAVGQTSPWDVDIDSRIPAVIVEHAKARDLHLELQGSIGAIADWWKALRHAEDPVRASRHLRVVRAGRVEVREAAR